MNKPASLALTALLLGIAPGTAPLHAAPAAAPGEAYYTEERIYQSRPDPTQERFLGVIGTTGLKVRVYSHVRLIENTEARVVVHWRNASVNIGYEWLWPDRNGWGLWTDEYWYIDPDAVSVRYQVSGRMATGRDRTSSSCLGTLNGRHHLLKDGRMEA